MQMCPLLQMAAVLSGNGSWDSRAPKDSGGERSSLETKSPRWEIPGQAESRCWFGWQAMSLGGQALSHLAEMPAPALQPPAFDIRPAPQVPSFLPLSHSWDLGQWD